MLFLFVCIVVAHIVIGDKVDCPVYVLSKLQPRVQIFHYYNPSDWQLYRHELSTFLHTIEDKRLQALLRAVIMSSAEWMNWFVHHTEEKWQIKSGKLLRNVKGSMHVSGLLDAEAQFRRKVLLAMAYVEKQQVERKFIDLHDTLSWAICSTVDMNAKKAFRNMQGWKLNQSETSLTRIRFSKNKG